MQSVVSIRSEELTEAFSKKRRLPPHLTITVSCLTIPSSTVLQAELIHLIQSVPRDKEQTKLAISFFLNWLFFFYFLIYWCCEKKNGPLKEAAVNALTKKGLFKGQLTC